MCAAGNCHPTSRPQQVRPSIRRLVDGLTTVPAVVSNGRLDVLCTNPLGDALFLELFSDPVRSPNSARYVFLDPRARTFYGEWDSVAHDVVASLHGEAGRSPHDRALSDLVGLLSTRGEEFRLLWPATTSASTAPALSAFPALAGQRHRQRAGEAGEAPEDAAEARPGQYRLR